MKRLCELECTQSLIRKYDRRYAHVGEQMREVERQIMLQVLDNLWKDHLANMDQLRQGIGLRAYAQKNPKQEYKRESFALFEDLLDNIKFETCALPEPYRSDDQ